MNRLKKTLSKARTFAFAGAWKLLTLPVLRIGAAVAGALVFRVGVARQPSPPPTQPPPERIDGDDPAPDGFYLMRCKKCGQVYKICSPARPCALTAADQEEHARHRNETSKKKKSYKEWVVLDAKAYRESIGLDVKAKGKP